MLDELPGHNKDDVSLAVLEAATDEQLKSIAADGGGKAALLRMVRELEAGPTFRDEQKQIQRVMNLVTEVAPVKAKGPGKEPRREVEVITFRTGGLDWLGAVIGAKGHTAIIVGGYAYSFEWDWRCGQTKEEYLSDNNYRDGTGVVLPLPEKDAAKLQKKLNDACSTGVYLLGGDICSDATANALETVISGLRQRWDPQAFEQDLKSRFPGAETRSYPKIQKGPEGPSAAVTPSSLKEDLLKAPDRETVRRLVFGSITDMGKERQFNELRTTACLDKLAANLSGHEFARVAAAILLVTPEKVMEKDRARTEALRLLSAQLNDQKVARNLVLQGTKVVIVPRNVKMTDLPQFSGLAHKRTLDGRRWSEVRGAGGKDTAITEENLLGTDVDTSRVPGAGNYEKGYSTTTHEFAHTIHRYGLSNPDKAKITRGYRGKQGEESADHSVQWVDGPNVYDASGARVKQCYASTNEQEYFAQLANAWLGTNAGRDPTTNLPRNNGADWVRNHEPAPIVGLLKRNFGRSVIRNANPRKR